MVNFTFTNNNSEEEAKREYFGLLKKHGFELELYSEQPDESIYVIFSDYGWELEQTLETKSEEEIEKHLNFIKDLGKRNNPILANILETDIYPELEAEGIEESKYR